MHRKEYPTASNSKSLFYILNTLIHCIIDAYLLYI